MSNPDGGTKKTISEILWNDFTKGIYIAGVVVAVVNFVTGPQNQTYTAIELLKEQVTSQKSTIDAITKTQQNDTQEVKAQLKETKDEVADLRVEIEKLGTIIDERIPKKK